MLVRQWGRLEPIDFQRYRRIVAWYSCGAASATATKLALELARDSGLPFVIAYCDTGSEHPDNLRFLQDCERWYGRPITVLKNRRYRDTWEVFRKERYLNGPAGAKCTTVLKKTLRERYERDGDLQVFGFDGSELRRAVRFAENQPEVAFWSPLVDDNVSKAECHAIIHDAGIEIPAMYRLGYRNNNCIGCPKGGAGYWNKIRVDFPEVFERMCQTEEQYVSSGHGLLRITVDGQPRRIRLRDLPPNVGNYKSEPPLSCGILCDTDLLEK